MGSDQGSAPFLPRIPRISYNALEPHWVGTLTLMTLLLCLPRGRVPSQVSLQPLGSHKPCLRQMTQILPHPSRNLITLTHSYLSLLPNFHF